MSVYVYIDYENMANLQSLPSIDGKYFVFIGAEQKSIPTSLVFPQNDNKIELRQMSGNGKNALDFHIAYFLAKHDDQEEVFHYILSKDKGFEPLIAFVNKSKKKDIVKRIVTLEDIQGNNVEQVTDDLFKEKCDAVVKNLKKSSKNRPNSENALKKHIHTFSRNEWDETTINNIVEDLYRQGCISKGSNNRLSYSV